MKYHQAVHRILLVAETDGDLLRPIDSPETWDIHKNQMLRLEWREYAEANFCQIYKDLLEMEQELAALRKYKESTKVYVNLADSLEAVLRLRGYERGLAGLRIGT